MKTRSFCVAAAITWLLCGVAPAQDGGLYKEDNGLVVIEFESTPPAGNWAEETVFTGFTFQSYYRWNGPDHFSSPGNGTVGYRIYVGQPGKWELSVRNRHEHADSTLENDVWVRMDGGTWFKLFSNGSGTVGQWNWNSVFDASGYPHANWNLTEGEHLLEFSGRSTNFMIDRFHLHLPGHPQDDDETAPESMAVLGTVYCSPGVANSSGRPGVIRAQGSTFVAKRDVTLIAASLPRQQFGYFLVSKTQGFVAQPGTSQGNLCLAADIARLNKQIQNSGPTGTFSTPFRLKNVPTHPPVSVLVGETWNFQAWHRDSNPGQTSNFTDAVSIVFQ